MTLAGRTSRATASPVTRPASITFRSPRCAARRGLPCEYLIRWISTHTRPPTARSGTGCPSSPRKRRLTGEEADELIAGYQAGATQLSVLEHGGGIDDPRRQALGDAVAGAAPLHRGERQRAAPCCRASSSCSCRPRSTGSAGSPSASSSRRCSSRPCTRSGRWPTRRCSRRSEPTPSAGAGRRRLRRLLLREPGGIVRRHGVDEQRLDRRPVHRARHHRRLRAVRAARKRPERRASRRPSCSPTARATCSSSTSSRTACSSSPASSWPAPAGLRIFWAWIAPGARTRGQALAEDARALFTVAIGLAIWLFVSGIIEGFVTPAPWPWAVKIGIGIAARSRRSTPTCSSSAGARREPGETGDLGEYEAGSRRIIAA